ncbi:helix-turn-helix transcriptional regulator [Phytoactinopolyspora endophytica]|uniref:helix-turn-helix transcriptional regulator n=1 Tax=Phytoactinopolyspora endophytica TaxID=1642495 RepID=UPI00101DFE5E|nr:helix-turn-helix transcriptional regulator [Phytoactinopolyspora endophytica]
MNKAEDVDGFLRSRRARLRPDDVGIPDFGERRRVPGLRRSELAQLAGVSVDYYVRLEQGRARNVSEAVLDALARALRLDDDERTHLYNLAKPTHSRRRAARPQRVRPQLRHLLEAMSTTPAYIINHRTDVLAWNRPASLLFADFDSLPATERNWARLVFLDESTTEIFTDWTGKARDLVSYLRLSAGRHTEDTALATLVGELSVKNETFRRMWADHTVREKTHGTKTLRHPLVGTVTLGYETFRLPDLPDQALISYVAEPGSDAETALQLLASLSAAVNTPSSTIDAPATVG